MKTKLVSVTLALMLVMTVVFAVTADQAAAAAKTYKWRMPVLMPKGITGWEMYQGFADRVKAASGGRIQITLYGVGEVMSPLETWDATANGVVQMDWSTGLYAQGKTPMAAFVAGLPYTTRTWSEMCSLLWDQGIEELARKAYAKRGIHLLAIFPVQSTTLTSKFPVNSVADLKGKKIRAGGIQADVLKALGAAPVQVPATEVYGALETGVVDGAVLGGLVAAGVFKLHEVAKYGMVPTMVTGATEEIRINKKVWEGLEDDLKVILESCAREHYTRWAAWQRPLRAKILAGMAQAGFKTVQLPESDYIKMREAAMKVYEEKAKKSPEYAEALEVVKKFVASVGSTGVTD